MKQIVFLPALIAWLFFAPLFRLANYLYPDTKHSRAKSTPKNIQEPILLNSTVSARFRTQAMLRV
jgi:hypothetical protein